MKGLMKLTMRNAKSIYTEANSMNILKLNVAVFSSLIFFLFAVVDTVRADDYADGKLGKALILDGESRSVKIPHYAGLKPLKGITVSAWIKPERVTEGRDSWQMIYGKPERHGHGFMAIGEYEKKHSLYFELKMPSFGNRIRHGVPLEPARLLDGKWHLVCVTYDGKAMTFYADGQEIGVKAIKGQIDTQGKAPAYLGSKRGREQFFKGGIDDVRVYNRALSADEIKTMSLANGEATVTGLAGWWKLDGNLENTAMWAPRTLHAAMTGPQSKEMTVSKNYLLLPIVNAANHHFDDAFVDMQEISLVVDGKEVRHVKAGLAEKKEDADWWAFFDISAYKGKTVSVSVQPTHSEAFALITQSDTVPGEDKWGTEPERPQFHFSQKVGWINDPNGMVYYKGEWHLYFQHNPVALPWGKGNMTWGHAVSKDLVSWKQLPNVFHSRRTKSGDVDDMYSGGAVVDWKNTGGWKTGENDVIVVTWTSTGRGECVAYSNDKGRTFTEYEGNPVIPLEDGGRDPKPLWYEYGKQDKPLSDKAAELGGHWVIARVCMNKKDGNSIGFYTSTDFKEWRLESQLPGFFECAELFTLPVDGNQEKLRWVVFAADAEYAIGDFDGKTFTPEHKGKHRLHHGKYYASQLFSDAPDGRRVQIGWGRGIGNDFSRNPGEGLGWPDSTFNQTFSFPTELSLRTTKDGVRMFGEPVKEIEKIHGTCVKATAKHLTPEKPVEVKTSGALLDIRAEFELGKAKTVGLEVDGKKVATFDVSSGKLNDRMPLEPVDGKIALRILIDRPMMEIFANHGEQIATWPYENDLNIESVKAFCDGGDAERVSLEVYQLNAKWDN